MEHTSRLLTTAEAATRLGVSTSYVSRLVRAGELQAVYQLPGIRGAFLFRADDLAAWRHAHAP